MYSVKLLILEYHCNRWSDEDRIYSFREICMKVSSQNKCLHCRSGAVLDIYKVNILTITLKQWSQNGSTLGPFWNRNQLKGTVKIIRKKNIVCLLNTIHKNRWPLIDHQTIVSPLRHLYLKIKRICLFQILVTWMSVSLTSIQILNWWMHKMNPYLDEGKISIFPKSKE